nr:hypothetical protein [uncultured Pseudogulbenkiania sp.]
MAIDYHGAGKNKTFEWNKPQKEQKIIFSSRKLVTPIKNIDPIAVFTHQLICHQHNNIANKNTTGKNHWASNKNTPWRAKGL